MDASLSGGDPDVSPVDATASTRGPRLAWRPVLTVVGVKLILNAAVSANYGWHRDELYYADAGRHLSAGYVDFPPVTPILAALGRVLFADSLVGLRLLASLAGVGVILVTVLMCRDAGGGRRAQLLAAVAITPIVLGTNAIFQTVSFDQLAWALVLWAALRLLQRPSDRGWLVLATAGALAWQTKFTVGVLLAGLIVGFVATRSGRSGLRPRALILGAGLFAVTALPNIWWQVQHHWASWTFLTGRPGAVRAEYPPLMYIGKFTLSIGVASLPLAVRGITTAWRGRALRPLAVALAFCPPAWLLLGGKSYYAAPVAVGAFAVGAASLEGVGARWATYGRLLPAVVIVSTCLAAPLVLPVLPRGLAVSSGVVGLRDDYSAELGWPGLAADAAAAWRSLSADQRSDAAVVAGSDGVAGALARFGPARGMDGPVVSGDLSWGYWPLPAGAANDRRALAVGVGTGAAPAWCHRPRQVGTVKGVTHVDTDAKGTPIWFCQLDETIARLRNRLGHD